MKEEKNKILEALSPLERKVLPFAEGNVIDICEKTKLDKTSVLRALTFLQNKGLVQVNIKEKKIVDLGLNGVLYLRKGLPERELLNKLAEKKEIFLKNVKDTVNLNENEIKVAIGVLKKKVFIEIREGKIILIAKEEEIKKEMIEEIFLKSLPLPLDSLTPEQKYAFENLKERKNIIEIRDEKEITSHLTDLGKEISQEDLKEELIEKLTPKMIKTASWKGKKFRAYDITSPVPRIYGGKRHFVNQAIDYAKKIWLEMGFKEMTGNIVVTSFWNFDALFTPQDHPARDVQDTFFISNVKGKIEDKKLLEEIKKAHEGELKQGKGWQEKWDEEKSKKVCIRTHTTCVSSQTLKKIAEKKEFPAKYFAIGKCFRNETVDWSHGFEFNQTEGIVVDENANFRQLLGYLKTFFEKMGHKNLRFRPHYFPYTEPSVEIDSWNEERQCWIEIGGAGMFRPEVTIPFFGKHIPVLAWGPGFDRIIMNYYNIKDLRELYKNDLNKLRETKFWML
ncbi:MAG: phenylalanine--tRNA ligase subunit alpha [Candidatus Pacearchaeota archaeon]